MAPPNRRVFKTFELNRVHPQHRVVGSGAMHPIVAGHGPTSFAGLSKRLDLKLVGCQEFRSGAVALRYQPSHRVTA